MKVLNFEQRSPEWFAARIGIPTASNFADIMTTKGEPSKQREKYLLKLAGEKVSGTVQETFKSAAMEHGIITEDEARKMYELVSGNTVEQVGFCVSDDGYGASPDGLIGEDGCLEIKCPMIHTHVKYLLDGTLPTEYFQQVQGQLLVTGRKWCDFVSYFPGLKPLIVRVEPDKKFHATLHNSLVVFIEELNLIIEKIK